MRKSTRAASEAFLNKQPFRMSNTQVMLESSASGPVAVLLLHDNEIAKLYPDGDLQITTCGWTTRTTLDRLNALPCVSATIKKGQLHRVVMHRVVMHRVVMHSGKPAAAFPYWMRLPPQVFPTREAAETFVTVEKAALN
jgi:hypothetical protein